MNRNIFFNLASQIYISILGVAFLPVLVKGIGGEAYGIIGFYSTLTIFFYLLDAGLTSIIGREASRLFSKNLSANKFAGVYQTLKIFFYVIAVIGGCTLLFLSNSIADNWLNFSQLTYSEVITTLQIMSIAIALRWLGGFYRGIIIGSENQVWLSLSNIFIATLRFGFVFYILQLFGYTLKIFFLYQLSLALLELVLLFFKSKKILKLFDLNQFEKLSNQEIKRILKLSSGIAITTYIWVLTSQIDKLVLSGILSLEEYGFFSIATVIANSVLLLSGPISSAVMPRMASLYSQERIEELNELYSNTTQLLVVISGSVSVSIWFLSYPLLYLWVGDSEVARKSSSVLKLYAIGNGFASFSAVSYYYQYARGYLKYHIYGNILFVIILIPVMLFCAKRWGGEGAGWVWLILNVGYFLLWLPYAHRKLKLNSYKTWFLSDFFIIFCSTFLTLECLSRFYVIEHTNRKDIITGIVCYSLVSIIVSSYFSSHVRNILKSRTKFNWRKDATQT